MHRNWDVVAADQAVEAAEGRGLFEAEQEEFEKVVENKSSAHLFVVELLRTFELSRKYSRHVYEAPVRE